PEVNPKRIGIIGHSFAGLTAPIAAVRSNDVAFVITLAGLMTDARVNFERLPAGLRAATTAAWTTLAQSSPTLSSSELESRLRDAFTSAMASVSDQERASVQGDGSHRDAVGEGGTAPPVPGPYRSRGRI